MFANSKEVGAEMSCYAKAQAKADAAIAKAGVGCPGTASEIDAAADVRVAVDGSGNVYVSDGGRIEKFACP